MSSAKNPIKGKCKFCGAEYTVGYMKRHLAACKKRLKKLEAESGGALCGYYDLLILPRYNKNYWLFIEVCETATLQQLDQFLRDIWLECCRHLSAFEINGVRYESNPDTAFMWGAPPKSMNCKLGSLLEKGMTMEYEYDFGSSTDLVITAVDYRVKKRSKEKITILSRNNPRMHICSACGRKPAVVICTQCMWKGPGRGFLCEDCMEDHECGEEMLLDVCNSPRMGVCGYCGSEKYPDQFQPD